MLNPKESGGRVSDVVIAVYDTAQHATQAVTALRRAGAPESCIHRHVRDGDEMTRERPVLIEVEAATLWSTLFGSDEPVEHVIHDGTEEAGATVVRVTRIPPQHHDAVVDILQRHHPAELQVA